MRLSVQCKRHIKRHIKLNKMIGGKWVAESEALLDRQTLKSLL